MRQALPALGLQLVNRPVYALIHINRIRQRIGSFAVKSGFQTDTDVMRCRPEFTVATTFRSGQGSGSDGPGYADQWGFRSIVPVSRSGRHNLVGKSNLKARPLVRQAVDIELETIITADIGNEIETYPITRTGFVTITELYDFLDVVS